MPSNTFPFGEWSPSITITPTTLTTIKSAAASALSKQASSITHVAATETHLNSLYILNQSLRGALARLTIISAENVLATATLGLASATETPQAQASVISQAENAIVLATLNLQSLFNADNKYYTLLSMTGNAIFVGLFGLVFVSHIVILGWSRNWYVSFCFIFGTFLEMFGYAARVISANGKETLPNPFIAQIVCLTIAPAFIMAGVYFILAQLIVIQGRASSIMRPLWFSYIFVSCDFVSLLLQAIGGALASVASKKHESVNLGSNVMLAGIAFQLVTMTVFVYFLFDFFYRSVFDYMSLAPKSVKSILQVFFGTPQGRKYQDELYASYDERFSSQRQHLIQLFRYLPLAIFAGIVLIYIRCTYRVVELSEGWHGHLITTEGFLFSLDGLMVFLTSALFVVFHPAIVFGKNNKLSEAIREVSNEYKKGRNVDKEAAGQIESPGGQLSQSDYEVSEKQQT